MALLALTAVVTLALMAATTVPVFATPKQFACEDPIQPGVIFILSKHEATEFERSHPGATCTELSG